MLRSSDLRNERGATAVKSQFKDITDPTFIGPGIWFEIHSKTFRANTRNLQIEVIREIKDIINNFPCENCKAHAQQYLKNHPPEEYIDIYVDNMNLGLFVYCWRFHNSVNARLNKPIMSWDTAFDLYNVTEEKKGMCSKSCMNATGGNGSGNISIPDINKDRKIGFTPIRDLYT